MHCKKLQLHFIKNYLRKLPAKYCFGKSCLGTLFPYSHVYARLHRRTHIYGSQPDKARNHHRLACLQAGTGMDKGFILYSRHQSCKKYRNLGTKFPKKSKTWQKNFQQSFVKKIYQLLFAISSITEQIFLNFFNNRIHFS